MDDWMYFFEIGRGDWVPGEDPLLDDILFGIHNVPQQPVGANSNANPCFGSDPNGDIG